MSKPYLLSACIRSLAPDMSSIALRAVAKKLNKYFDDEPVVVLPTEVDGHVWSEFSSRYGARSVADIMEAEGIRFVLLECDPDDFKLTGEGMSLIVEYVRETDRVGTRVVTATSWKSFVEWWPKYAEEELKRRQADAEATVRRIAEWAEDMRMVDGVVR